MVEISQLGMKKYIFVFIVMVAIVLRFWSLGSVPPSPDWDEAALGYNAYSILKTGRDEYGTFLPRTLRSFDDYKPPLYVYLSIPPVAIFGLSTWSVRLPSAVMGVLAVIGTYFLVIELLRGQKEKGKQKARGIQPETLAALTSFLLAISPWHLQFSRIAFEANTGVTLNVWGLVAFLRGLRSLPWMMASAFFFGLSLYAYHSERVFVPMLLIIVSILWRKELFADAKKLAIGIIIGILTAAPLLPVVLDSTSVTRLKGTSSLSDQTGLLMRSTAKLEDDRKSGNVTGALFDNRRIVYAKTLIDGYISHFSLRWLFLVGDNDRHHAPDNGLLYLWELPFFLWGIYAVWRNGGRLASLLLSWILITPIAASPTSETPHAIRTLVALPALQICTALGIVAFMGKLQETRKRLSGVLRWLPVVVLCVVGGFVIINTVFYLHMYHTHLNHEYPKFWQYGYEQAVRYAEAHKEKYDKIIVSTSLEQPHMFFLFYTKYDPKKYLEAGGTASGGFAENRNRFDKYEFRPISNWGDERHDGTILYIGSPMEVPGGTVISYPNGTDAIHISE